MKFFDLYSINKLTFGHEDIARVLGITPASAKVSAHRYVKQGLLIRLKRNMYMLRETWQDLDREQKYGLANYIQSPSYISLMTALDYYEISTQMQQDYFESIALKRSKRVEIDRTVFTFSKVRNSVYFGFQKKDRFFIATPEKAFLDAIYLTSLGRYNFDTSSIDFGKLNAARVQEYAAVYPDKTQNFLERYEYFRKA